MTQDTILRETITRHLPRRKWIPIKEIVGDGYKTLNEGDSVSFEVVRGPKGLQATGVTKA